MFENTKPEKLLLGVHVLVSVGVTLSMAGYFPEGEKVVNNLKQQTLWAISLAVYTILLYLIKKDEKKKVNETLEYLIYLHFIISLGIFASFHQKEIEKAVLPLTKEMKYLWGASSAICAYSFYIVYEEEQEGMGHEETEGHGGGHGGGH